MRKTPLLLLTVALWGAAPMAHADDWAELSWRARWGEGTISYRRDVPSTTAADGTTTYADSIGYFNVLGWGFPETRGHRFIGGGGDIVTRSTTRPGCQEGFEDCRTSELVFRFDTPFPDLYPSWQLNLSYDSPLDAAGHLPMSSEGGVGTLLGYFSNNRNGLTLTTLDGSLGAMNRSIAAPVPEPGLWVLMAVGALLASAGARRARPSVAAT